MSKPEPLKGKQRYYADAIKIHHSEDVKSAVEFLKEQIYKTISFKHTKEWKKQDKLIDEAFADVV